MFTEAGVAAVHWVTQLPRPVHCAQPVAAPPVAEEPALPPRLAPPVPFAWPPDVGPPPVAGCPPELVVPQSQAPQAVPSGLQTWLPGHCPGPTQGWVDPGTHNCAAFPPVAAPPPPLLVPPLPPVSVTEPLLQAAATKTINPRPARIRMFSISPASVRG
jgi:hypothetical protein